MPVNKRSKYRGSRTCGGGTHKNRRGAGNRGGRGRAGHRDHNQTRYRLAGEIHNGKHGFNHVNRAAVAAIDVGALDEIIENLAEKEIATREGDAICIDISSLGYGKVLGSGKVTHKLNITASAFSEQAKEKIEEMGGQALLA